MLAHNSLPASVTTTMAIGIYKLQNMPQIVGFNMPKALRKVQC